MSDTERVRAWRQRLKDGGLVPMTIWVKPETKARYQDLASRQHRSGSELAQLALDAYRLDPAAGAASVTDTAQIRSLIREELDQTTAILTVTVTATVTETIKEALPAMVQAAMPRVVADTVTESATDTRQDDLGKRKLTQRQATELRSKRQRGVPIKTLMQDYGLSRASVHRYLSTPRLVKAASPGSVPDTATETATETAPPPRGRQRAPSTTAYDPDAAYARMQALQAQGQSLAQIAATLTAEGIRTRHGQPWHKSTVTYVLKTHGR
jgi:hypothetical protein